MKKLITKLTTLLIAFTLSTSLMAIDYVVSGAGTSVVNGTYLEDIVVNGKTSYKYADATTYYLFYKDSYWYIHVNTSPSGPFDSFYYIENSADEPPSSGWSTGSAGVEPFPTLAESQTYSLEFDGSDDYVDLGTSSDLKPTAALTVEVWANADDWQSGTTGKLVSNTHVGGYDLSIRDAGITFTVYSDGVYRQPQFSNSGYSGWHHIAGTFDGQYAKLYIDGVLKNTVDMGTSGNAITYGYPSNSTLLGAEAGSSSTPDGSYFDGKFDDVRIWDVARTQAEIQEYICEDVSSESNLIAYYRMSNGSGTSLIDNSSTSYTGTLYDGGSVGNGPTWQTDYLIPDGDGTTGTEYQIQTLNHLWWLSQNSGEWSKLFEQTADIDMTATQNWDSGDGFTSIGNITIKFTGSYDGQGHTITGIYINRSASPIGFFGQVNNGTITNLNLESASVTGNWYAGGLVGDNNGLIDNCSYTGDVAAPYYCGGIAARNSTDDIIINSYANANVTVTGSSPAASGGGFTGGNRGAIINCYSHGNVLRNHPSSSSGNFGAFCGQANAGSSTMYCYSTGDVTYTGATDPTDKGFIGIESAGTSDNNFFDSEASNQTTGTGATAKTTEQMKTLSTFTDAGWDFTSPVWARADGTNNGYPNLESNTSTKTWIGGTTDYLTAWTALSNWDDGILPTATDNISIPGNLDNNPTISGSTSAVCNKLVIVSSTGSGTNASLTIDDDGGLTVSNNLDNDGTLTINSTADGTGSLIVEGTATGDVAIQRYLTQGKWHYISAPVNDTRVFNEFLSLTGGTNNDQFYWWDEDGTYVGSTGIWFDILNNPTGISYTVNSFVAAQGYAITYAGSGSETIGFSGIPYDENKVISITNTLNSTNRGANLVGNPFCSDIAINSNAQTDDNFITQNSSVLHSSAQAVYFWDDTEEEYVTKSNIGEVYAEPGQGFMVIAKDEDAPHSLEFNINIRKHGSATFYKSNDEKTLELMISDSENRINKTTIAFLPDMTNGLDPSYDAMKLKGNPNIALYTRLIEDNGTDFAIQALKNENIESYVIPIGVDVAETIMCEFSLNTESIEGYPIYLKDRLENTITNLKEDNYNTLVTESGIGRFYLHFTEISSIEDGDTNTSNTIRTYASNNTLYILNPQQKQGTITIYNLTGQKVAAFKLTGDTKQQQTLNVVDMINIVKIQTNDEVLSGKVIFR